MNERTPRHVLIVDDEPNIVNAVRRELSARFGRYRYETEEFSDPVLALERARIQRFDVVISDFRMPGMDGMEFLTAFAKLQPDCARIVLSGQTDMPTLVGMVNEIQIYRFIPKPWRDYYLRGSVSQAIQHNTALLESRQFAQVACDSNIPIPASEDNVVDQILLVDDDQNVLNSISRVFTRQSPVDDLFSTIRTENANRVWPVPSDDKIQIHVTTSPLQALKMADTTRFSCIVADFKMPQMNGIDLLQKFMELQPDCVRVLISGVISQDDLVYAVDSAHIFGFVGKPWNDVELNDMITRGLAFRKLLAENQRLAEIVKLARES